MFAYNTHKLSKDSVFTKHVSIQYSQVVKRIMLNIITTEAKVTREVALKLGKNMFEKKSSQCNVHLLKIFSIGLDLRKENLLLN